MKRLILAIAGIWAAVAYASPDPVADTRQIMAGTVTTKTIKADYLAGKRDSTTAFQGALTAYKAVRAAESPTPPPPSPGGTAEPIAYDTSIGTGVDANGFAILPLRAGAHRYFVRNGGSDGRTCRQAQDPATPLATINAGVGCMAAGIGDQLLLGEGSTFNETLPQGGDPHGWLAAFGGFSAAYPTVFQSYDPTDPLNEAKYGRGDQRGARPVLTKPHGQVGNGVYSFIAIRGFDFNPGNIAGPSLAFVGQANGILIANNLFRYTGVSFDVADKAPASAHILRHNSLYGQWSVGGRTGGYYDAGTKGITVEDNVFYHNGWKIGGSRDAPIEQGGATVFSHAFYLQTNTWNAVVRRNLTMDGAGDGGIARGDIQAANNVSIDNPACLGLGGGPNYGPERPEGIKIEAAYNVCFGDADTNSSHKLGWGISTANGVAGSRVHHNLLARTRDPKGEAVMGFSNGAFFDQPSYAMIDNNVLYRWASPPAQTYWQQTDARAPFVRTTFEANAWGGPPMGTNVNSDNMTFPKPYTAAELWPALGCGATKEACSDKMLNTPEISWGAKANALLLAGYGLMR